MRVKSVPLSPFPSCLFVFFVVNPLRRVARHRSRAPGVMGFGSSPRKRGVIVLPPPARTETMSPCERGLRGKRKPCPCGRAEVAARVPARPGRNAGSFYSWHPSGVRGMLYPVGWAACPAGQRHHAKLEQTHERLFPLVHPGLLRLPDRHFGRPGCTPPLGQGPPTPRRRRSVRIARSPKRKGLDSAARRPRESRVRIDAPFAAGRRTEIVRRDQQASRPRSQFLGEAESLPAGVNHDSLLALS